MKNKEAAIVIPTIRNLKFLKSWGNEFRECIGIIIEDHKTREVNTPKIFFRKVYHYSWKEIDQELGKHSWIISRKNAGIRVFGFWKAYQLGIETVITIDDDCYPVKNQKFVQQHLNNLALFAPENWYPTYPHRKYYYTRGIPYSIRNKGEVVISHGLWKNILDFDAPTHLLHYDLKVPNSFDFIEFIPKNYFFPMCSMNLAFKTKIAPIMYFPLMGYNPNGNYWGYDRFDDIWAGIFAKKIIDHLGFSAANGSPFVEHKQVSNVFKNLEKEAKGMEINEVLFKMIEKVRLKSTNPADCYFELAQKVEFPQENYFKYLKRAMKIWAGLFA